MLNAGHSSRRRFLLGSTLAATSVATGCQSMAPGSGAIVTATADTEAEATAAGGNLFDYSRPEDNLDAFVKVIGSLDGKAAWITAQGRIYALREGVMPTPLVAIDGLRWVRLIKKDYGYQFLSRDWAFYKDIVTGEPLDRFTNPYTGAVNETSHTLTRLNDWDLTPNGQVVPDFEGEAWLVDRPFVLPWTFDGDLVGVPLELIVRYVSGYAGGEWMNLISSAKELNDPRRMYSSMQHAWTGHSGWMRWMGMKDIPGRTLWQSTGHKVMAIDNIRPEIKRIVGRYFPGSLEDAEGYTKSSYTVSPPGDLPDSKPAS